MSSLPVYTGDRGIKSYFLLTERQFTPISEFSQVLSLKNDLLDPLPETPSTVDLSGTFYMSSIYTPKKKYPCDGYTLVKVFWHELQTRYRQLRVF